MLKPLQYLRHPGRNLGYTRIEGKQKYFPGPWDSAESRAAYDKLVEEWREKHDPQRRVSTVADQALSYMKHPELAYRKHGEPTGEVDNIRSALKLLLRTHRHTPLRDISCTMLVQWRDSLIDQPDRRQPQPLTHQACSYSVALSAMCAPHPNERTQSPAKAKGRRKCPRRRSLPQTPQRTNDVQPAI